MPAIRTPHRDVILRVPRAINVPKAVQDDDGQGESSSWSSQQADGTIARQAGAASGSLAPSDSGRSGAFRRSASPVKGRAALGEGEHGEAQAEATARQDEVTASSRYHFASQATSAAEWNSLLIWARRQRGPQWDSATGMWQVDEGSTEYYAFCNDPARHTKLSSARRSGVDGHNGLYGGEGRQDGEQKPFATSEAGAATSTGPAVPRSTTAEVGDGKSMSTSAVPGPLAEDSPPPIGPGGRRSRAR